MAYILIYNIPYYLQVEKNPTFYTSYLIHENLASSAATNVGSDS